MSYTPSCIIPSLEEEVDRLEAKAKEVAASEAEPTEEVEPTEEEPEAESAEESVVSVKPSKKQK